MDLSSYHKLFRSFRGLFFSCFIFCSLFLGNIHSTWALITYTRAIIQMLLLFFMRLLASRIVNISLMPADLKKLDYEK